MWDKVRQLADQHEYMGDITREQHRVKATGEVFTPTELVIEIVQQLDIDQFAPGKTVIDPACGDGQFLIVALGIKMYHFGMSREEALKDIYGVDIMRDNVDLCRRRLGGGNIVMGNTLEPTSRFPEQSEEEHKLMREWFTSEVSLEDFF
jgi:SAM-dependent methyltransferase